MQLTPLEKLLQRARKASDESARPEQIVEAAKHRALSGAEKRRRSFARPLGFAFAFAAALAVVLFVVLPRRASITYVVGEQGERGAIGAWISAGATPSELRFSEGTKVVLAPNAHARVTATDAHGARVLLERGSARAHVVHVNEASSWDVHAGPFEVHVVGTEFEVSWDPAQERLVLGMVSGKVRVRGPLLAEGRTLSAGEELIVQIKDQRSEVHPFGQTASLLEPQEPKSPRAETPLADPLPALTSTASTASTAAPLVEGLPEEKATVKSAAEMPAWRALAAQGKHREAMEAAEREGFDSLLASSSADVLLELSDEARFAGAYAQAERALLRARRLGARGRSAFLLGKLAADHQSAPASAVQWFETYLTEEPSGSLAEQALGRVMELERKLGEDASARRAAERYLARYPKGAYAGLAKVIAGH